MPVSSPTYGVAYGQTECNTNAQTICTFIDTANTNTTTNKAAAIAGLNAIKKVARVSTGLLSQQQAINDAIAAFA